MTIMVFMVHGQKSKHKPLQGVFEKIFTSNSWGNQWELYQIHRNWNKVVGETLAQISEPAYFRRDVLWVYVENSVWMQQLQFLKLDLLARVRRVIKTVQINDIRFQLKTSGNPVGKVGKGEEVEIPDREINPDQYRAMKRLVSGIGDERCREALLHLWEHHKRKSR